MTGISASNDELLKQAQMTAHEYLLSGKDVIDDLFGAGYARAHPDLLAAYMKTAATDFFTAIIAKELGGALEGVAMSITDAANALSSDTE